MPKHHNGAVQGQKSGLIPFNYSARRIIVPEVALFEQSYAK